MKVLIKPNCIKTHGSPEKAFDEAVKLLKERYLIWVDMPLYKGVDWELNLQKQEPKPEPKPVGQRKSVVIRGTNIKDSEKAIKLLKKTGVEFYEIFSDELEPIFIDTLSAYSYKGLKQIKLFAAMHGVKTLEPEDYFDSDPDMLRCSTCGTKYMRGCMCPKCF